MFLIIGAGVGGLWTAHELLQAGVAAADIRVLEASPKLLPALGGSFALSGGLRCFQSSSSSPEFLNKLSNLQCQPKSFHYMELNGYEYGHMDGMDTEFPCYGHFMRGELIQLLAETLPEGILMLHHVVDNILENNDQRVLLQVRKGNDESLITMEADILIGADGIHSIIRKECFGSKPKEFVGINMIYFVIPAKDIQDIIDNNSLLQSDAMMAIDDPSGLLLPSGSKDDRTWIFCSAYRSQHLIEGVQEWEQPKEGRSNEDPALQQVLDKIAATSESGGATIPLQAMLQHATRKMNFSLYQTFPCYEEWYHNRVVLVGDAIHATTPFLGRGANEAIQSATCLARLLGSHAANGEMDLATCTRLFQEYRDNRYPKTKDVIERSKKIGRVRTGTSFLEKTYRHLIFRAMFMNNAMLYRKIMAKETQSSV